LVRRLDLSVVGLRADVRVLFASPVLRLPAVRPALRIAGCSMRIEVGPDATNGAYSLTIVFGVTSLPSTGTAAFNPPLLRPPVGGAASSTLTVTMSTPIGSYPLNLTATDSSEPRWVQVNTMTCPADFAVSVSPNSLTISRASSRTTVVTVA
jgi:hypothetical protein